MRDFEEDDLDEHLRFGAIQVGDHLADILAGFFIRDDDQSARLRVNRNHRFADCAVVVIGAASSARTSGSSATASATASESAPAETTAPETAAASLSLSGDVND